MAEVVPVYLLVSGNYATYQGIHPLNDAIGLGGLTMAGNVVMTGGSPAVPHKITGLASASSSGDALAFGQSGGSLAGLSLTGNLAMGSNKITGLSAASDPGDAPNYSQLQSVAAGVQWKAPSPFVFKMTSDSDQGGSPPGTANKGDAYVVNNWGLGYNNGDIVEYDGTQWNVIVDNSGGEPPDGTTVIVTDGTAAGSFTGQQKKVATYNATTNTWAFLTPTEGEGRTIIGDGSVYEFLGYIYDTGTSQWALFNGAGQVTAGAGLAKNFNELSVNVKDGIKIDTDYLTLSLATNPGLQLTGTSPNQVLSVKPDGANGVEVGANGVAVKVETDGAIVFDGINGGLQINLETTNPTLAVNISNELGVKYATLTSGLTKNSTGLQVYVDNTTVTINASGQLEAVTSDPGRYADNYEVSESIAVGNPVYWSSTANRVAKGDAARAQWPTKAQIFGVAETAQATVGQTSLIVSGGPAYAVLTAATPGTLYWLAIGGGLTTTIPTANNALIRCGWAMNTTDLFVAIFDYGLRNY